MLDINHQYAILWDMDGILVNTGKYHYQAWEKAFDELDIPFSEEQFQAAFGINNTGILEVICGKKLPPDQELQIGKFFDAIVSGCDIPGKPDPGVFLRAAWKISVQPENCVVIEDAGAGVEGAKNAGMKCIALTTTNNMEALFQADLIFDSLVDLKQDSLLMLFELPDHSVRIV